MREKRYHIDWEPELNLRLPISAGAILLAGLFAPTSTGMVDHRPLDALRLLAQAKREDPRVTKLRAFFRRHRSPAEAYAPQFVEAADRHSLDWRILPSLAILETGGGRTQVNNNLFGWGNGTVRFSSWEAGIHSVAEQLASSDYYRGKNLDEQLRVYNYEVPDYGPRVKRLMRQIDWRHPLPKQMVMKPKAASRTEVAALANFRMTPRAL